MAGMRFLFATDGSTGAGQALRLLTSSFEPSGVESVEVISVVPLVLRGPDAGPSDAAHAVIEQASATRPSNTSTGPRSSCAAPASRPSKRFAWVTPPRRSSPMASPTGPI